MSLRCRIRPGSRPRLDGLGVPTAAGLFVILSLTTTPGSAAKDHALNLRWQRLPGAVEYHLQVARDPEMKQMVLDQRVKVEAFRFTSQKKGEYFWHVRGVDDHARPGRWSVVRSFRLGAAPAPSPSSPPDGRRVYLTGDATRVTVTFSPSGPVKEFIVQTSPIRDFSKISQTVRTTDQKAGINLTEVGELYWRVSAIDEGGAPTEVSPARRIRVALGAPKALFPAAGTTLGGKQAITPITLRWSAMRAAKKWKVRVKRGKRTVLRQEVRKSQAVLAPQGAGTYRWEITPVAANGKSGKRLVAEFNLEVARVSLAEPAADAALRFRGTIGAVRFAWQPLPEAKRYAVEVSASDSFATIAGRCTAAKTGCAISDLAPGKLHWRVTPLDEGGEAVGLAGVGRMELIQLEPLETPAPLEPVAFAVVDPAQAAEALRLAWKPVTEAGAYDWVVARPDALADTAPNRASETGAATGPLAPGEYAWRVRAVDPEGATGQWSEAVAFHVGPPPTERVEIAPEDPWVFADGESVVELQVTLRDSQGRPIEGADLAADASSGSVTAVESGGGIYRVQLRAPEQLPTTGVAAVTLRDRDFRATTEVRLAEATNRLLLAARVGWKSNVGSLSTIVVGADLGWRLPLLRDRLVAALRFAYFQNRSRTAATAELAETFAQEAYVASLAATAIYEQPIGVVSLYGGAGPRLETTYLVVGGAGTTGFRVGAELLGGVGLDLGPGQLIGEVTAGFAFLDDPLLELPTATTLLMAGYRLSL